MTTKYEQLSEAAAVAKDHIDYGAGVITINPEGVSAVAQHLGADLFARPLLGGPDGFQIVLRHR